MDLGLKDKVVIVTGSSRGIGRATAITFAQEGATVIINSRVQERADKVAREIEAMGGKALPIAADITKAEEVDAMVKAVLERFGHVDILVNNGDVWVNKPFEQTTRGDWDKDITSSIYGTLNCIAAVVNHMIERHAGVIINIASDTGRGGEGHQPVYAACKEMIIGLTKSLCMGFGKYNIRVNSVSPSLVITEGAKETMGSGLGANSDKILKLYPLGRFCQPEDIANMVVFLASDKANYVTGQTYSVNGGRYAF